MKTLIICDSIYHGNTKKIAEVFARELDAPIVASVGFNGWKLRDFDLIGFGSGIYDGSHYAGLLKFVDQLERAQYKKAFIFSTSGFGGLMEDQHRSLRDKLRDKDFEIVGEFNCRAFDNFGPLRLIGGINKGRPNEKDLAKAREFARGLKTGAF